MTSTFRFNFSFQNEGKVEEDDNFEKCEQGDANLTCGRVCYEEKEESAKENDLQEFRLAENLTLKLVKNPDPKDAGLEVPKDNDVVTNVYEGGFKLWECERYLLNFLNDRQIIFKGKSVAELGCGAGISGLLALVKGAKRVVFQDFNKEVLEAWTMTNVLVNHSSKSKWQLQNAEYFYGDWGKLAECDSFLGDNFEIVLMSETIYVPASYAKLKNLLAKCLRRPNGIAYMAAKSYYFGTGGSIVEFCEYLKSKHPGDPHRFVVETELEINEGVRCAICSIKWN